MFAVYVGALLFGGVLLFASMVGFGHDGDAHVGGDAGADQGHGHDEGSSWWALLGIRFWSFGCAFFGLTGLLLRWLGGDGLAPFAPVIASVVGVGAGLTASATFRMLTRDTVGLVKTAAALVGREGLLLLPVERGQRGKVRLVQPGGGHVDMVAESDDDALGTGSTVLIVEVRGNVAVVARGPAGS